MTIPRILIVAGSDSGGGAGIQADIKTVTMLGGHAMTAITAITAQNTLGVQRVMPVPTEMVLAQIESVVTDIGVDAIKIGMLGSAETANALADYLASFPRLLPSSPRKREPISQPESHEQAPEMAPHSRGGDDKEGIPIVFDPVMVATSGSILSNANTIAAFGRLAGLATLITPNTPELEALSARHVANEIDQSHAAEEIMTRTGCRALLAKGGHLIHRGETYGLDETGTPYRHQNADRVFDYLYTEDEEGFQEQLWDGPRIATTSTHGTGCTLASAIATGLGAGLPLADAIARAIAYVRAALANAPRLGAGHGPMGHALGTTPFDLIEADHA